MADFMSSRGAMRDDHDRPTTPTAYSRSHKTHTAMRALDTHPTQQETFYDDATPVDNLNGIGESERHSHDLSFSDGTRDSVVDNMLLSLDQLTSTGPPTFGNPATLYSSYNDDFFLTDNHYPPSKPSHVRGHTHTSSHSSDYDVHIDDTSSRYSSHHSQTRGRRSNSSSNFPHVLGRKESVRGAYPNTRDNIQSKGLFENFGQPGHSRGAGKKGSKSSGSSSLDFGYSQVLGTQRLTFGHRSASFDHGSAVDRSRIEPVKGESILDRSRPNYQAYDYEAAPEPTIPAGPRRVHDTPQASPSFPPAPTYAPPQAPAPRRKSSVRSSTSRTLRKNKSQPEHNLRLQAQEFVNAQNLRDLPAVPVFQDPPAPSPTVAMRKPMFPSPSTPNATPKERPGFFRRVFGGGSSKSSQQSTISSSVSYPSPNHASPSPQHRGSEPNIYATVPQPRPRTTPSNTSHIVSQLKSHPKPPQTATSSNKEMQQPPQPTLAKKHSSFFRRRKKSVSESKPPVMSLDFKPPNADFLPSQPSPSVNSLRKAMNPYLGDLGSPQRNRDSHVPYEQQQTRFSPGYRPHKDATVRAVKPDSREGDSTPPSSRGEPVVRNQQKLPSTDSPKLKLKVKRGKTSVTNDPHDDSFLADSSSCNEERSGGVTPKNRAEKRGRDRLGDERRRPATSPHSPSAQPNTEVSASASGSTSDLEDDGWIITAPTKVEQGSDSEGGRRVWLRPSASEEKLVAEPESSTSMTLPLEGARLASSTSAGLPTPPSATSDDGALAEKSNQNREQGSNSATMPSIVEHRASIDAAPTDADRERALAIFNGSEEFVNKSQAAAMLGDTTLTSSRIRKAYMELFDWSGFSILHALRDLCSKLVLKAETQQVDRILTALSVRWCECNPNHGFKAIDVVHTICYSLLLLNTDLHMADIESRMTKTQFVRNTLPTVRRVCNEAIKESGEDTLRPQSAQFRRGSIPWDRSEPNSPNSPSFPPENTEEPRARSRLSIIPPARSGSDGMYNASDGPATGNCTILVNNPHRGSMKAWEDQVEIVLKEFYNSIRQKRLPLHGASRLQTHEQPSSNNLSVTSMLRRTPSVLSKAGSDTISYRGRSQTDFRSVGARFNSKTRSRGRLYPASTVASSRTSLDEQSVWSPAGSSTWSRYSFGKTQTSTMSMESLGSHFAHGDYQQAIGFANALSQAIIREEGMTAETDEEFTRVAPLLEDESLELAGAPWAKEGIVKHKHHLESIDKKSKDRSWTECFAVIEKGYVRLFSFTQTSKSLRHKNKSRPSAGSVVGGGNWMDNAEALDTILLRQSIASALPPPGYSKSRPHVFALSLPTGAVHLFQVGTPDIVREFVSTANYWSARLSKEPLIGGVSNIEYGWGDGVINPALISRRESNPPKPGHVPRPSMASSIRSSVDQATGAVKARLPGDKVTLMEWSPPVQSMMASNLLEVDQLKALSNYVKSVEEELAHHNELRAPMLIAFSPRHPNAARAMANWERKSSYLLREIVKFRTYIDSLNAAQAMKDKIYAEREKEKKSNEAASAAAAAAAGIDGAGGGSGAGLLKGAAAGAGEDADLDGAVGDPSTTTTDTTTKASAVPPVAA